MHLRQATVFVLSTLLAFPFSSAMGATSTATLPAGAKVYLVLDQLVTSKRGESGVGEIVPCKIWRDIEMSGVMFIRGGTPAGCRIEKVSRRNMGGKEGKISIGAIETKAADGQSVLLSGGYNKEGAGHKAVVWTVGLLLLWPILFVPGGNAELPPGTVFDASTVNDIRFAAEVRPAGETPRLNLAGIADGFSAEILLDEFLAQEKPEVLKIKLTADAPFPTKFAIDSVNGKPIDALPLKVSDQPSVEGGSASAVGQLKIKPLAKHFQKGINRFNVSYGEGVDKKSCEVILDIQM